jgi:hypothetical protein
LNPISGISAPAGSARARLSPTNQLQLLALLDVPIHANVLFSKPSVIYGYTVTPCTQCDSLITTRDGEAIPALCERVSCSKFDRFPLLCVVASIHYGGIKKLRYNEVPSLVLAETERLRYILPPDAETGFWIPRSDEVREQFVIDDMSRERRNISMRVWHGEDRPHAARGVQARSHFPPVSLATRLVKLAYPPEAAASFFSKAHLPWMTPKPDRYKTLAPNMDGFGPDGGRMSRNGFVALPQPSHPYNPASPSRRTKTGGGLTEERVRAGLKKMRTNDATKDALLEIVYRGRGTREVAPEFGLTVENLYVYASRLRKHIRSEVGTSWAA